MVQLVETQALEAMVFIWNGQGINIKSLFLRGSNVLQIIEWNC